MSNEQTRPRPNPNHYPNQTLRHAAKKSAKRFYQRILISWMAVAVVFSLVGGAVGYAVAKNNEKSEDATQDDAEAGTTEEPAPEIVPEPVTTYPIFGAVDDRVFTHEISLDWGSDELDYVPLTDELDDDVQEFVFYLCAGYNLDFTLVMAIIQQESNFKPGAVSVTNDYGLMQINHINHAWLSETLGITDFLDPYQNVRAGTFILRKLFERYGDTNKVLMAYNMGEGNASKLWAQGVYSTSYTESVTKRQAAFCNMQ